MNENTHLLDLSFLKEFCDGNKNKMMHYIHTFLETTPEQLRLIKDASDNQQWMLVKSIAHSLKPQVAFIGLPEMQKLIEQIESESTKETPLKHVSALVVDLDNAMETATDALIQTLLTLS